MAAEGIAAIGINPIYLVGQVVNFIILMWVLKKFIYGPVLKKLEERAKETKKGLETAEKLASQQEEWEKNQKKQLQKVQEETSAIIAKARNQAKKEKEIIVKEAKEEAKTAAKAEYSKLEEKLNLQEKKLREKTGSLVIAAAKKVLAGTLDEKTQNTILKKQLDKLKEIKIAE